MKRIAGYMAIILLATVSFLFSPGPVNEGDKCGRYIQITRKTGFMVNCDSGGFIVVSIHPSKLFEPEQLRQGRPLYILAGTITGYSLYYMTMPLHRYLKSSIDRRINVDNMLKGQPDNKSDITVNFFIFYTGYFILNVLILAGALYLFEEIAYSVSIGTIGKASLFIFLFLLASNQVTKAFFWSPHQQMFAFFTPLLCIYTGIRLSRTNITYPAFILLTFIAGHLLLVYGNFLLLLPVILFCYFIQKNRDRHPLQKIVLSGLLLAAIFFVPTIAWIAILKANGTTYYNFEMAHSREIVWIADSFAMSLSAFMRALLNNSISFFGTLKALSFFVALIAGICFFGNPKQIILAIKKNPDSQFVFLALIVFVLFLWLLGFYAERLTFSLAPLLLVLAVLLAGNKINNAGMRVFLLFAAICWHCYNVFSYGPFS